MPPTTAANDLAPDPETAAGADWVRRDADHLARYAGRWVVAVVGRVVADGTDPEDVRRVAAERLDREPRGIVVCAVSPSSDWHAHANLPVDLPPA